MLRFGKVSVEAFVDGDKFSELIASLNLIPPVLIKPNWGTVECYTEAGILDWTLAAIPGEKIVIESHGWARNEETLLKKTPQGLTRANLRRGNRWFMSYSGLDQVLEKHHVEYLNLTEEVWAGRVADPELICQAVEARYSPVQHVDLYSKVPSRLYALRGGTLLSLAKAKLVFYPIGVSLSIKNLFGLIPGPSRGKYHGREHACLDQSIIDINKVYRSLFTLKGIVDVVHSAGSLASEMDRTKLLPGCGAAFASEDTVALDAFVAVLSGCDPGSVGHLRLAGQHFGFWDPQICEDAARSAIKIF